MDNYRVAVPLKNCEFFSSFQDVYNTSFNNKKQVKISSLYEIFTTIIYK